MASRSWVEGSTEPPLSEQTLSDLTRHNASHSATRTAVKANGSYTFGEIDERSARVAKSLLDMKVQKSEHIGILAGNCIEYIDVFLGIGRIGRVAVALNPTDSPEELCRAVAKRFCKALFVAAECGSRRLQEHVNALSSQLLRRNDSELRHIVLLGPQSSDYDALRSTSGIETINEFLDRSADMSSDEELTQEEKNVKSDDGVTLQFTSGTTGKPKAAMLTHRGIINNALHLSYRMGLTTTDTLCCPAALFRTFGIVMGFLTAFARGTGVVLPGQDFDPETTISSIFDEKCTALLGEYRLFFALLDTLHHQRRHIDTIRTCLAAGAVVPVPLREAMHRDMGVNDFVIAHGQTEVGPMVFITNPDDPKDTASVGRIMPHRVAKVIDETGAIVPRGQKGELCVSGYGLLQGYYGDEVKTKAALRRDDKGVMWFHTGDEASIDEEGYCYYGGRLDDIITTKDGSRVYPDAVEQRLLELDGIAEASVVLVKVRSGQDEYYLVGAFLRASDSMRPTDEHVSAWLEQALGAEKVPQHLFWVGDRDVGDQIPKTYNGKQQKHKMSEIASKFLQSQSTPL